MQTRIPPIPMREVLHYLGWRGTPVEDSILSQIRDAMDLVQSELQPNVITRCFVLGSDGKLEQRFVTVGKSLWGSYTQILDGLSAEDLIAFPYGKNLKPGAPTRLSDISELYS